METTNETSPIQSPPQAAPIPPVPTLFSGPLKVALIVGGAVLVLLLLVLLLVPRKTSQPQVVLEPSPTLMISPSSLPRAQSEFSKTEPFILFEGRLEGVKLENEVVNLTETELAFPLLDMNVTFQGR